MDGPELGSLIAQVDPIDWVTSHAAELGVGLAVLVVVVWIFRTGRASQPDHAEQVRTLVSNGQHREAGDLQLRYGKLAEAFNIYTRGEVWDRASFVAERMGDVAEAARLAENGEDFRRAMTLYEKAKNWALAVAAARSAGALGEVGRLLELDPQAMARARAEAWEDAFNHCRSDERLDERRRIACLVELAVAAHRAYQRAGDDAKAEFFRIRSSADQLQALQQQTQTVDVPPGGEGSASDAATPGTMLRSQSERYVLGDKLGEGGMGVVYRARDTVLDRVVAIKLLPQTLTADETARRLFQREAKAAAGLTHPNIVVVYDFGLMRGRPFLSMEYVEGASIAQLIADADGLLPYATTMEIAQGLLRALAFAHERGVVHRDVKPANVLRGRDGLIKLTDFGIAKLADTGRDKTTMVAGTPAYMAPEQFVGKGIDHRTDLFAVGVTLYELLTGQLPFPGIVREAPPTPPSSLRGDLPPVVEAAILQCLETDTARRPSSAMHVARLLGETQMASPRRSAVGAAPIRRERPRLEYSSGMPTASRRSQ